jgi:putative transcriptional regulator
MDVLRRLLSEKSIRWAIGSSLEEMIQPQPEPPAQTSSITATGSSHTRLVILLPVAFAHRLKEYRTTLFTKQSSLAQAIGCSEAAVSYWETGRRLPQARTMTTILAVLDQAGVSRTELVELHRIWQGARWASSTPRSEVE